MAALPSSQERMQTLMRSPYSTSSDRIKRMLTAPAEGDFWQADHVLSVHLGGGEADLSNYATLCTPCHAKKTARETAVHKRKQLSSGSGDLRQLFAKQPKN